MSNLLTPLKFKRGPEMTNRFMLAPLTNLQSHDDGTLSDEEFNWLTMRAAGGFGLTMTCAAHVQAIGQGFPGQLGIFEDKHIEGLSRLAAEIKRHGSVAILQLHHAGMRSPANLVGEQPVCPSDNEETGARAFTHAETVQLVEDFVLAAERAERAGFDGVEVHGAHGYVICQFLSDEINFRDDEYGGSLENRCRVLFDIVQGIRHRCGNDFIMGVRLSPERFGMHIAEVIEIVKQLYRNDHIDFLDMSLWDVFKEPNEEAYRHRPLFDWFSEIDRGDIRLGAAGQIRMPEEAERLIDAGADFAILGRAGILNHDFPNLYRQDQRFAPQGLPATREHLAREGISPKFLAYLSGWKGFVAEDEAVPSN